MADKIDFIPGESAGAGSINSEGCCPCCGGPCFDNCELCEKDDPVDPPTCCTGRCCTCFPGSHEVVTAIEKGQDAWSDDGPGFSKIELEASFFLTDCVYDAAGAPDTVSPCNGYLGSITLCGDNKVGPAKTPDGTEVEGGVDALCIRKTDSTSPFAGGYTGQDCTKQICNQKNRKGEPEGGGMPIYEIWCGAGRICYEDQTPNGTNAGHDVSAPGKGPCEYPRDCTDQKLGKKEGECGYEDDNGTSSRQPVQVGQFVEMSICCCKGNNDPIGDHANPDCNRGVGDGELYYNCDKIKEELAEESPPVKIDQVCSCVCYTVDFKFHDVTRYPFLSVGGAGTLPDNKCWKNTSVDTEDCVVSSFSVTLNPSAGCAGDSKCPMEITDCRCMDVSEDHPGLNEDPDREWLNATGADGWYICAEYINEAELVCSCCAGKPDIPPATPDPPPVARGGCKSPNKIRVFITVKENSKARHNPRGSGGDPDNMTNEYCPTCGAP